MMTYEAKELSENVNISKRSPLGEFFLLLGGALGILLVLYIVSGFAVDIIAPKISPDVENNIGQLIMKQFAPKIKSDENRVRLEGMLDEFQPYFPDQERSFFLHVIDEKQVNAGALPGGHIVVFQGLLDAVESDEELAFVLAHELGHFAHRDHLKGLGRGLVMVTLSILFFGQDNGLTNLLAGSISNAEMKFSQRQENQADVFALDLFYTTYGHVRGTTDFMARLAEREKRGKLLYYFATHPHPGNRLKAMQARIEEMGYGSE